MLYVKYCKGGESVSDFEAEEIIINACKVYNNSKCKDMTLEFSTENVIILFRVMISRGIIKFDEIEFIYEGICIKCNEKADLSEWPIGFCDIINKFTSEIFKTRI